MPRTKKIRTFLEREEYSKLLAQPDLKRAKSGLRNLCLMRVMAECGLRVSEALQVKEADLNLITGYLKILGKGNKERFVVVNSSLAEKLDELKRTKRPNTIFLFVTTTGRPILQSYVRAMVRRYALRAGLSKRVTPHTLRHTFATNFMREFKDIYALKAILGHHDIKTTEIYLHSSNPYIEKLMRGIDWGK